MPSQQMHWEGIRGLIEEYFGAETNDRGSASLSLLIRFPRGNKLISTMSGIEPVISMCKAATLSQCHSSVQSQISINHKYILQNFELLIILIGCI